jgi:hypothetical protein
MLWLFLIVQNVIAQLITGPPTWNETAFSIYYVLLLCISGAIAHHFHCLKIHLPQPSEPLTARSSELSTA